MASYNKNQPETIQSMFGSIASRYDKTNAILSLQMHRLWNAQLVRSVVKKGNPLSAADLCSGTGEIAFSFLKRAQNPSTVHLIDFCPEMLACAKQKALNLPFMQHRLNYVQADVQKLPLGDKSVECATMAYGIRNVQDPAKCIKEVYRVLKPGATFGVLELTQPSNPLIRLLHTFYLKTIMPVLGKMVTSNKDAYQYLCNSIQSFIKPKDLAAIFSEAGFKNVTIKPLHGGIATIITGEKE